LKKCGDFKEKISKQKNRVKKVICAAKYLYRKTENKEKG